MTIQKITLLHLSLINGLGPDRIRRLYAYLKENNKNIDEVYQYSISDFKAVGFSEHASLLTYNGLKDTTLLHQELDRLEKYNITILAWYEDDYPSMLKTIHLPPVILYVQGTISHTSYVGIVGSRNGDRYGYDVVTSLVPDLVRAGVGIVSGGALGIDTCAHQATINAGGVTVVILGGGLLRPYPTSNKKLFSDIVSSGGAIVSSFPLLSEPVAGQFPARNRIIAGIAKMTVVIQAAAKSGALITAEYALQEGRAVGAVPGAIHNPLSAGCHTLIGQGARLISSARDILDECLIDVSGLDIAENVQTSFDINSDGVKNTQKTAAALYNKKSTDGKEIPSHEDNPVLMHCEKPMTSSDLSLIMKVSEQSVNEMLFDLQLEGKVEQDFAGLWKKVQ